MEKKQITFALVIVLMLAAVGGGLSLIFTKFINFGEVQPIPTSAPKYPLRASGAIIYNPPAPEEAPDSIKDAVMLGYRIMTETRKFAGAYVGNKLTCTSCHFKGGITAGGQGGGLSLVGVGAKYPDFRTREDYAVDLVTRTNSCLERSMNGRPLPPDSREMTALLTYYQWISKGLVIYTDVPWLGLKPLKNADPPDKERGTQVYALHCGMCHGRDGQGTKIAPPLWGPESFNDGAGMSRAKDLSAFAHLNMPMGNPNLTVAQAWDVAAFVTSRPRPHFVKR